MATQTKLEISLGEIAWPGASCKAEAIKESVRRNVKRKLFRTIELKTIKNEQRQKSVFSLLRQEIMLILSWLRLVLSANELNICFQKSINSFYFKNRTDPSQFILSKSNLCSAGQS